MCVAVDPQASGWHVHPPFRAEGVCGCCVQTHSGVLSHPPGPHCVTVEKNVRVFPSAQQSSLLHLSGGLCRREGGLHSHCTDEHAEARGRLVGPTLASAKDSGEAGLRALRPSPTGVLSAPLNGG